MNNKKIKRLLALCSIVILGTGVFMFAARDTEQTPKITSEEKKEEEQYQKEQEDLAKRIDKNLEEKSKLEEKEGVAEPSSLVSTSKKDKNKTTDTVGTDKKPSKPTTESGGNGNTSENTNKTPSKDEVVPGFSEDEIIDGGGENEDIYIDMGDDDTPVGEM